MPKIDDATLELLRKAREACQPVVDRIDAAQVRHVETKRAKHFQLLPCFKGTPPAEAKAATISADAKAERVAGAELAVSVADGVDAKGKPKSTTMKVPDPNWADVLEGAAAELPLEVRCDEYQGPRGVGYVRVFEGLVGGKRYRLAENVGPEESFGHPWREVVPLLSPE